MIKYLFISLVLAYLTYSIVVYSADSCYKKSDPISAESAKGFAIWQQYNCQSCHQLYGLGGYMGPDLTNIMSDSSRGENYAKAFITNGSAKMPKLSLKEQDIENIISLLKWIDKSGKSVVKKEDVTPTGNYQLKD